MLVSDKKESPKKKRHFGLKKNSRVELAVSQQFLQGTY